MPEIPARVEALRGHGDELLAMLSILLMGEDCPVSLHYHPDADPGDGSGWCVEVGDTRRYGHLLHALREHVVAVRGTP